MNKLQKHLLNLAIGEFAALCVFGLLYRSLQMGTATLAGFLYLMFVLFQGSTYWGYRYILLVSRKLPGQRAAKFWNLSRRLSTSLMGLTGALICIRHGGSWDLFWGIGAFIFAFIEYINYFWYRLSYGKSGFNLKLLLNKGLKKSSINRLIESQAARGN